MAHAHQLRSLTQRLTSTPVQELPYIAHFLASSISACLGDLQSSNGVQENEAGLLIHKFKTRISSLLQERRAEGRFTAVVLIKAVIEVGGREYLSISEPWARGLVGILNKPDPPAVKKLCIITVSRIFALTQEHPALLREITTPLLPAFITACLSLIKPRTLKEGDQKVTAPSPLLPTVLKCWLALLPHNPSTFRPFVSRIRPICLSVISDESSPVHSASSAQDLLIALHLCSPKNGSNQEWTQTSRDVISAAHSTADQIFRSVIEDWTPSDGSRQRMIKFNDQPKQADADFPDTLSLSGWSGIHQGSRRFVRLINILERLISNQTAQAVSIQVGLLVDLTGRALSVSGPSGSKGPQHMARYNSEVGREEREELWAELPAVYIACLRLLKSLIETFRQTLLPMTLVILEQTIWVFNAGCWHIDVRTAVYEVLSVILPTCGPSFTKSEVKNFSLILQRCCHDLLPPAETGTEQTAFSSSISKPQLNASAPPNVDAFLTVESTKLQPDPDRHKHKAIFGAAFSLLHMLLKHVPASILPQSLRTQMDSTCILLQHKRAMLASVLNPPAKENKKAAPASIMPFLARSGIGDLELEALLRPRMPVLRGTRSKMIGMEARSGSDAASEAPEYQKANELDLLSRPEYSLEPGGIGGAKANFPMSQNMNNGAPNPGIQGLRMTSPLKRDFMSMEVHATHDGTAIASTLLEIELNGESKKKIRLDDEAECPVLETGVKVFTESAISVDIDRSRTHQRPSEGVATALQGPGVPSSAGGGIETPSTSIEIATKTAVDGGESDSSDFEIPQIDVELDTDDDEEI